MSAVGKEGLACTTDLSAIRSRHSRTQSSPRSILGIVFAYLGSRNVGSVRHFAHGLLERAPIRDRVSTCHLNGHNWFLTAWTCHPTVRGPSDFVCHSIRGNASTHWPFFYAYCIMHNTVKLHGDVRRTDLTGDRPKSCARTASRSPDEFDTRI